MALVVRVHEGESIQVGSASILFRGWEKGGIALVIEAPREVPIVRAGAVSKSARTRGRKPGRYDSNNAPFWRVPGAIEGMAEIMARLGCDEAAIRRMRMRPRGFRDIFEAWKNERDQKGSEEKSPAENPAGPEPAQPAIA